MNPLYDLFYLSSPLIAALVNIILLVLVWRFGRKEFSSRLFSMVIISFGLSSGFTFLMRNSIEINQALIWDRALIAAALPAYVLYYHFTVIYSKVGNQKVLLTVAYLLIAVLVILVAATDWGVKAMAYRLYGYAPIVGSIGYLSFLPLPIFIIGGGYNLVRGYLSSRSIEERNRLIYLIIASLFPLLGAGLDALTDLPPAFIWGNVIFCILCSVSILRYHLLDIRVVARTSLVYLIVSSVFAIPYLIILYILMVQMRINSEVWWIHAIVILIAAITLRPIYTRAQRIVDKLFYRERYDYLIALQKFMQETHDIKNIKKLISSLTNLIGPALQSSSVHLMLSSDSGDFFELPGHSQATHNLKLNIDEPLMRWILSKKNMLQRKEMAIIPQLQALSKNERGLLDKTRAEILVPLLVKGNLIGLIILGEKMSQLAYSHEDIRLISVVAARMATELENARLYESERALRQRLEEQDAQKTEFLHSVAHELKTPLTAILSSSELLAENLQVNPNLNKRLVTNVRKSAFSMNRRVAELIDLARMQIGQLGIKLEPVEIDKVITDVTGQLEAIFTSKEQTLTLKKLSSLPKVNADREKIEQVLYNLLSNANKFSPTGSNITVTAKKVEGKVIVEVEDSALPITEREKKKIFDPYYRSEDPMKRDHFPGLGLGLSVSKRIVELHQGEIWVKSQARRGNIFAFSLTTC
ncbi:MAG: ATP-binding protein [Dehalococcoidales bacterium]